MPRALSCGAASSSQPVALAVHGRLQIVAGHGVQVGRTEETLQ
jgi:hypothetical protein